MTITNAGIRYQIGPGAEVRCVQEEHFKFACLPIRAYPETEKLPVLRALREFYTGASFNETNDAVDAAFLYMQAVGQVG